jgi:hypothetical protein
VKVTVQPALHIVTMERRDCDARPGMRRAAWTVGGRSGRSRVHVCIDCTLWGVAAGNMLVVVVGALVVRK